MIYTPTVCRPDPRTTPQETSLNENENFQTRNTLLKKLLNKTYSKDKCTFLMMSRFSIFLSSKQKHKPRCLTNHAEFRHASGMHFFVKIWESLSSIFFMSLQRILMSYSHKLLHSAWQTDLWRWLFAYIYEKYQNLLILHDNVKNVYFPDLFFFPSPRSRKKKTPDRRLLQNWLWRVVRFRRNQKNTWIPSKTTKVDINQIVVLYRDRTSLQDK